MSRFKPIKREMNYLFPPSMHDWLPEQHLARFIVEIVEPLDVKPMERASGTRGSAPFHPALLPSILVYGYATGVFSSRNLEHATYDSVAFRFVAADEHPDHDTLNTFRKRFLKEIEGLMVQGLMIARTMGVLKLGNIALDGSKLNANASKHRALSYGHIKQLDVQLQGEVTTLMELAEAADNETIPDGMNLPEEITRRGDRLKAIAAATIKIEQHAKERFEQEPADYQAKLDTRAAKSRDRGKPARGTRPVPPVEGARDKDQINLTDEESRIMKVSGGGFDQCYNGQLAVDMDHMLIVTTDTVQACNDTQQVAPILKQLKALPGELGQPVHLVADTGDFSEANVKACGEQAMTPLIAMKREAHHLDPLARWADPPPLKEDATEVERMRQGLLTRAGRALYAKRKCTVEPVIGIIKAIGGFRQFSLRGLEHVKGEWNLVAMAWNVKRMFVLAGSCRAATA
ncbi:IS1182 family transposase [Tabrizicola sp.]|uniref:IS1182 family transposase n=1 Tax=Tabrizicola sp. TaxID=2005166 RepID=UPI002734D91D|nr:IS1182 family transposase [Tabrizicola sp.]MDP3197661.1 IS1182 family transposase [Tabrizicola sp.]